MSRPGGVYRKKTMKSLEDCLSSRSGASSVFGSMSYAEGAARRPVWPQGCGPWEEKSEIIQRISKQDKKQWSKTGEREGLGEKRSVCSIFRTKVPTISHPSGISRMLTIRRKFREH